MTGSLLELRTDPESFCGWVSEAGRVVGAQVRTVLHDDRMTVLDVHFDPPPAELPGYPAEHVRVTVFDGGKVIAVPVGGHARMWEHRYCDFALLPLTRCSTSGPLGLEFLVGALCLWDPADPERIRWTWRDGLDGYLRVVQRHLWCEEYWRRHGAWPVEDAPHGSPSRDTTHSILTPTFRAAA